MGYIARVKYKFRKPFKLKEGLIIGALFGFIFTIFSRGNVVLNSMVSASIQKVPTTTLGAMNVPIFSNFIEGVKTAQISNPFIVSAIIFIVFFALVGAGLDALTGKD